MFLFAFASNYFIEVQMSDALHRSSRATLGRPGRPRLSSSSFQTKRVELDYGQLSSVLHYTASNLANAGSASAYRRQSGNAPHRAYIALGSNLGDRIGWIEKACRRMTACGIHVARTSFLYETEAMYVENQTAFVNGVCEVQRPSLNLYHPLDKLGLMKLIDRNISSPGVIA